MDRDLQFPSAEKMAEWLVIGFCKCWNFDQMISAAGLGSVSYGDELAINKEFPFMPAEFRLYKRSSAAGVRAFVKNEFPKLHDYLDKNHGNAEKLLRAVPQIVKLKCRGVRRHHMSKEELREIYKDKKELAAVTTANKAARKQQLSTQRGAWNVCKK